MPHVFHDGRGRGDLRGPVPVLRGDHPEEQRVHRGPALRAARGRAVPVRHVRPRGPGAVHVVPGGPVPDVRERVVPVEQRVVPAVRRAHDGGVHEPWIVPWRRYVVCVPVPAGLLLPAERVAGGKTAARAQPGFNTYRPNRRVSRSSLPL